MQTTPQIYAMASLMHALLPRRAGLSLTGALTGARGAWACMATTSKGTPLPKDTPPKDTPLPKKDVKPEVVVEFQGATLTMRRAPTAYMIFVSERLKAAAAGSGGKEAMKQVAAAYKALGEVELATYQQRAAAIKVAFNRANAGNVAQAAEAKAAKAAKYSSAYTRFIKVRYAAPCAMHACMDAAHGRGVP